MRLTTIKFNFSWIFPVYCYQIWKYFNSFSYSTCGLIVCTWCNFLKRTSNQNTQSSFWNRFQEWYSISSNTKLLLSELEVMFGIIRCHSYCLVLNHLIILGKYFLYVNALNTITYQFDDFVSLVREKINLEKYIAVTRNKEKEFRNKWKFFLPL